MMKFIIDSIQTLFVCACCIYAVVALVIAFGDLPY